MAAAQVRPDLRQSVFGLEIESNALATRLPELLVEARRVAQTVTHGTHGRRRAGPGETFWQFRQFENSDSATLVDWRRSASSDHLYIREREWEAAHTLWLWSDTSPSMDFNSHLSATPKRDRGLVILFALAQLLVQGGERVGLLGMLQPRNQRGIAQKLAEALVEQQSSPIVTASLPPDVMIKKHSDCILISDFLEPIDQIAERVTALAASGAHGHLVQILDPAEETLPYEGRTEFIALEGEDSMIAERVETLRDDYRDRLLQHREQLHELARKLEWSLLVHHTDRPTEECLLALHMRLSGRSEDYRAGDIDAEITGDLRGVA